MRLRRLIPLLVVLAVGLALPGAASASAYSQVLAAFNASHSATIPPCQFSTATLDAALKQSSTYQYQYGADFTDAIGAALSARGDGDCSSGHRRTGGLGAGATLRGGAPRLPNSATSASGAGLPLVLVLAFTLGGACLVVLAGWLGVNALGVDPRPLRAARHSVREAEYRIGASWEDFSDRLRRP